MRFTTGAGSWVEYAKRKFTQGTKTRRWMAQSILITLLTWFGGPTPAAGQAGEELPPGPPIVYVSNTGGGVTEVNASNNLVIATAPFANNVNGVAVTPDGRRMYVSNRDAGQVTVFGTRRNVPLAAITVGNLPAGMAITLWRSRPMASMLMSRISTTTRFPS
jgi:YVTN family beta-propeller protein